jgi:hypothetical protein
MPFEDWVRLGLMTIYGSRLSDVAALDSDKHINLTDKTITIPVGKRERPRPQPIPESLLRVFAAAQVTAVTNQTVCDHVRSWCRRAGVHLPPRSLTKSFRRMVVTELARLGVSDSDQTVFMKWNELSRRGMIAHYDAGDTMGKDHRVLTAHPVVSIWEEELANYDLVQAWLQEYEDDKPKLTKCAIIKAG